MKQTRPPCPPKPEKCRICGHSVMFPYSRYASEGGDDWLCSRTCDKVYADLAEASEKARGKSG